MSYTETSDNNCGDKQMRSVNDIMMDMSEQMESMQGELESLRIKLKQAAGAWNDEQIVVGQTWHPRSKPTPHGYIWATNGVNVWLIMGRGEPISVAATDVTHWCDAFIPAPPMVDPRGEIT